MASTRLDGRFQNIRSMGYGARLAPGWLTPGWLARWRAWACRAIPAGLALAASGAFAADAGAQTAKSQSSGTATEARPPEKFFVTGHSLTDNPYPEYIAAIAQSRGISPLWNQQIGIGSPIRGRTRGLGSDPEVWHGYSLGKNRNGQNGMNVLQEFKARSPKPYDTLIITERHKLLATLIWENTVAFLRHYHDRFIEQNPHGRTFFFESWESVVDKKNLAPWIDLEQQATKVWGCAVVRINMSLAHEGRADRIAALPIGAGLAHLLAAVANGQVSGTRGDNSKLGVDDVMPDDVHLSNIGKYYAALLTYATITGRPVDGVWRPPGVPEGLADQLQKIAWSFVENRRKTWKDMDLAQCRALMVASYCDASNAYVPDKWSAPQTHCKTLFSVDTADRAKGTLPHPFVFDPQVDAKYWLPAPR
jgi:hypothetical protein